jgi:GNAT superfamily N-acetyltransferase
MAQKRAMQAGLADLMAVWAKAWAISRQVTAPEPYNGGWRTEVGRPEQLRRYLFSDCDREVLAPLAASITEPFVFLKVCTDEATLRAALPEGWLVQQTGYIMVDDAPPAPAILPPGYTLALEYAAPFIRVQIRDRFGEVASSGQVILVDGIAVYDAIATEPDHRRRGLGQALMRTLGAAAADVDVTTGALSSSLMGRDLYRSLGWRQVADYITGASPGTTL